MNFTAIDFETANRARSSICSVGIAIVKNSRLVQSGHFLIKPTPNHYDSHNTFIHGIDDRHTRNELPFKYQWRELYQYFNKQTVVAHNASFDCSVLRFTLDAAQLPYPDMDYHCTYRLAKALLPLGSHKLNVVSSHFNIKLMHHNAESDAKASALIALRLCEKYKVGSLEELSASVGYKTGKFISQTKTHKPFSKK